MNPYLLVDGKNLLWRAEGAMSSLSSGGNPTGGIHGFLSVLLRVVEEYEPKRIVVAWEDWKHGPTSRKKIAASYKDHNENMTPERKLSRERVAKQAADLMEFFSVLDVKQAWSPTWEADDVMGTLSKRYEEKGRKVVVFTGDRDLLQCISKSVTVLRPVQGGAFEPETAATVKEKYGVGVNQLIAWKALVGDPSDGYAGAKGIGEKSATAILQKFHDVREVLYNAKLADEWKPLQPRWAKLITEAEEDVLTCQRLATINRDAPLKFLPRSRDFRKAMAFLSRWEMKVMLTQFSKLKRLAWGGM